MFAYLAHRKDPPHSIPRRLFLFLLCRSSPQSFPLKRSWPNSVEGEKIQTGLFRRDVELLIYKTEGLESIRSAPRVS